MHCAWRRFVAAILFYAVVCSSGGDAHDVELWAEWHAARHVSTHAVIDFTNAGAAVSEAATFALLPWLEVYRGIIFRVPLNVGDEFTALDHKLRLFVWLEGLIPPYYPL